MPLSLVLGTRVQYIKSHRIQIQITQSEEFRMSLPVYTIWFKIPYLYIVYLISMSAEIVLLG